LCVTLTVNCNIDSNSRVFYPPLEGKFVEDDEEGEATGLKNVDGNLSPQVGKFLRGVAVL
jgi:hypothetical protein